HVLVHLVGEHDDVAVGDELRQRIEVGGGGGGAGGVVGTVEQQQPGARAERRAHALPVVAKTRLRERQPDAAPPGEPYRRFVGIVRRVERDRLLARTEGGLDRRIDGL